MPRRIPIHGQRLPSPTPRVRGRDTNKDYDKDWRKLRKAFLLEFPICMCDDCKSGELRLTKANTVDHIKTIAEHPELRLVWSNLRSMNKICHDRHTRKTENEKIRNARRINESSARAGTLHNARDPSRRGRVTTLERSITESPLVHKNSSF